MDLAVAIVSYNSKAELEACLASLRDNDDQPHRVVIADNGSADGSLDMVRELFPEVTLIDSGRNLGFARASNLCWRKTDEPLVLFLNPDTVVPKGGLLRMVAIANERPSVGALGPLLKDLDGSIEMSYGTMMSLLAEAQQKVLNALYRGGHGPLKGVIEKRYGRERLVDWVSGACLLTRRELLEQIGGFDEAFFLYSEDVDLCARIRAEGKTVLFTPEVEITHRRGASADRDRGRAFVESQRSRLHFYAKHYGQPRLGLLKLYMATKLGVAYLFRPSRREAYRSVLDHVFHGESA